MNSGIWLLCLVSEVRVVRVNWVVWSGEMGKKWGGGNWVKNRAKIGGKLGKKLDK